MEIEKVRIEEIRPSEVNKAIYNPHHEDRVRKLANNIKRNGLLEPLIVSQDGVIISGHTRYAALQLLGRTFVQIRRADVMSSDPEFLQLLIDANDQRVKTTQERLNEIAVQVDPEAYWERREEQAALGKDVDLESVSGSLSSSRNLSDNYADLAAAIAKVMQANKDYLPMTLRGVHYQLLDLRPIASCYLVKRDGEEAARYGNEKKFYDILSKVATMMRINGSIPFEHLRDDGRRLDNNRGWDGIDNYLQTEIEYFCSEYNRDLMQTQPYYIAIICEKETVSNVLDRIAVHWGMPVLYTKGGSSIDIRYRLVKDNRANGSKPMRLLILSDMDPAGYRIQDSFVGSLKQDFGIQDVKAYRIGITKEQIKKYSLHSNLEAKKTDNGYRKFVQVTGLQKAYELDALPPSVLRSEVEEAIKKVVDLDLYNEQVRERNKETTTLEKYRVLVRHALSEVD